MRIGIQLTITLLFIQSDNLNLRLLSEGSGLAGHGAGAPSGTGGPGGPGALAPHNSYRSAAS